MRWFNWRLVQRITESVVLLGTDKHVAMVLAAFAGDDGRGARPTLATLADLCGRDVATIKRSLRRIEETGLIRVQEPARGHRPVVYEFDLHALDSEPVAQDALAQSAPAQDALAHPVDEVAHPALVGSASCRAYKEVLEQQENREQNTRARAEGNQTAQNAPAQPALSEGELMAIVARELKVGAA